MARIVMKFGGTSVADVAHVRRAAERVRAEYAAGHQIAVEPNLSLVVGFDRLVAPGRLSGLASKRVSPLQLVAPFVLPQLFGEVEGRAANWAPIGLVIVGGLTTSTFLTLVIIPTIYSLIDDLTLFCKRVARAI